MLLMFINNIRLRDNDKSYNYGILSSLLKLAFIDAGINF